MCAPFPASPATCLPPAHAEIYHHTRQPHMAHARDPAGANSPAMAVHPSRSVRLNDRPRAPGVPSPEPPATHSPTNAHPGQEPLATQTTSPHSPSHRDTTDDAPSALPVTPAQEHL